MTHVMTDFLKTKPHRPWVQVVSFVLLLSFASLALVPAALGETTRQEGTPAGAGLQAASWLVTLPYGALKVGFALVGGVVGGMTYALTGGDLKAAQSVWTTTMYGTYIITPEHLKGEKPVHFIGESEEQAKA